MKRLVLSQVDPRGSKGASWISSLLVVVFALLMEAVTAEAGIVFSGSTTPGSTNWREYIGSDGKLSGIYLDVDTSSAGFTSTPNYFTSLGGDGWHWSIVGATSIYKPTRNGFRVYILNARGAIRTPEFANEKKWHINWVGIESNNSGSTTPGSTNWREYIGSDGKLSGIYLDVDTSSAGFTSTPNYFTSLGGDGWHWSIVGATSIYKPTRNGFRVYILNARGAIRTPEFANEKKWHINWVGIEPTPPRAPTDLTITRTTTTSITLKWKDRSSNEDGFVIQHRREGGGWLEIGHLGAHAGTGWMSPWVDTELEPNTEYCYRVRAFNGYGANSSEIECKTTESPQVFPDIAYSHVGMEPTYFPAPGQPFRVWFYFCNIGTGPTGPFRIRLELDGGAQYVNIDAPSYASGACDAAFWVFPWGLLAGDHYIYAYFDSQNTVAEIDEYNNIGYIGFSVWE